MSECAVLLTGGRVIDPAQGVDGLHDVRVEDGTIAAKHHRHLVLGLRST